MIIGKGGRNIPGKNFESTGGFGPWMITADEIEPGRELKLEVRLNGEVVQSGSTGQMIFSVPRLISYASAIFTLSPGDVIVTGTPSGVGFSRKPPRFMKLGDVCQMEIEGVGLLRNPIVPFHSCSPFSAAAPVSALPPFSRP